MPKELKKKTFEEYLMEQFAKEEPTVLDDEFPDAFDEWITDLGPDDWLKYQAKYANNIMSYVTNLWEENRQLEKDKKDLMANLAGTPMISKANLKEFLLEAELETKEGEAFSLVHAITNNGVDILTEMLHDLLNDGN